MLKKPKKSGLSFLVTGIKVAVVAELAFVAISYYVWSRMNRSREFRFKMYNSFPSILKGYYWSGETLGGLEIKKADYEAWGIEESN